MQKPAWTKQYGGNTDCDQEIISYRSDLNAFFCDVKMSYREKGRIILNKLEEKRDEIAPFV